MAGNLALWFGLLAAPVAWFLHLNVSYVLVPFTCATGQNWLLYVASAGALALALAGAWVAWRQWRSLGRPTDSGEDPPVGRVRFMAVSALAVAVFFTLIVLAAAIPPFFLDPCRALS